MNSPTLAHRLASLIVLTFTLLVPGLASAATIHWVGGSNGDDFNTAADWSTGTIPGPSDTAVISSGTFTVSSQITAGIVNVSAPYVEPANQAFNVTGVWTFSNTFTIPEGQYFQVQGGGSITVTGATTISGASLYIYGGSTLAMNGVTSFTSPTDGAATLWFVQDSGSHLNFPALKTIVGSTSAYYQYLTLEAYSGGTLNLPVLTSATQSDAGGYYGGGVKFEAYSGGAISAPVLASMNDSGAYPQSTLTDDATSSISAPKLATVVGASISLDDASTLGALTSVTGGSLAVYNGTISLTKLASLSGSIGASGGATVTLPALKTVSGPLAITGNAGTLTFSALTSITSGTVQAYNAATISFPVLTSVSGLSQIYVYSGSLVSFAAVTSYASPGDGTNDEWYVQDASSQLNFPALKTIAGSTSAYYQTLTLYANSGGTLNLPVLTSITQSDAGGFYGGSVVLNAYAGSVISAPLLATFNDNGQYPRSSMNDDSTSSISAPKLTTVSGLTLGIDDASTLKQLTSFSGSLSVSTGTVALTHLTSLSGTISVSGTAQITLPALKTVSGPLAINGNGGTMTFSALTSITNGTVSAQSASTFSFPVLTSVSGLSQIYVYSGSLVSFAAVTSYASPGDGTSDEWYVQDAGSQLSFPALKTIAGSTGTTYQTLTLYTNGGGTLSLPALTSITQSDAGGFSGGAVVLQAYSGGAISTPLLATFNDNGQSPRSSMNDDSTSAISAPKLTTVVGIALNIDDTSTLGALTSITGGSLTINNGTVALTKLASLSGPMTITGGAQVTFTALKTVTGTLSAQGASTTSFPVLTSLTGLPQIYVYSGATVSFAAVTSYASPGDGTSDEWYVQDAGSQLNFPALKTIVGSTAAYYQTLTIYTNVGGTLNLPVLTSITQSDAGGFYGGTVVLEASTGGAISAPLLATFNDNGQVPRCSMIDDSTSSISASKLATVTGIALNIDDPSTLGALTSITGGTLSVNGGTVALTHLTTMSGTSSIDATGGAQVSFPALTTLPSTVSIVANGGTLNFTALAAISGTNGSLAAYNAGTITMPALTSVNCFSTIYVYSGSQVSFPAVTSYTFPSDGTTDNWYVQDAGSQLNFPALKTIGGSASANQYLYIEANISGTMNFPVLTSIIKSDNASSIGYSGVQLSAYNAGTISAPKLATFDDNGAFPNSTLTLDTSGGVFYIPYLMSSGIKNVIVNGITQGTQTLAAFATIPSQPYGTPYTVTPPAATSHYPVKVSVVSGPATISGYVLTFTGTGTVTLSANQPGNIQYTASNTVTTSFTVIKGSQTITFPSPGNQVYGVAPFTPSATASSGLAVAISYVSGPATVSGNTVTVTGVGTVVLAGNQTGNANYNAASQVTSSFKVTPAPLTVAVNSGGQSTYGTTPVNPGIAVTAGTLYNGDTLASIGLGDSFALTATSGAGTYTINVTGTPANYTVTPVSATFVINKASQTLSAWGHIPTLTYSTTPVAVAPYLSLVPTASSGLPVKVAVQSGPATLNSVDLTLTGVGTVTLVASQAGNANYLPATSSTTSFAVVQASQTITFPAVGSVTVGQTVTLKATSTSGLPITYSIIPTTGYTGTATITGSSIKFTGAGNIKLAADQPGNADYKPAPEVTQTVTVH